MAYKYNLVYLYRVVIVRGYFEIASINDTFGHAEGDRTLQLISNTILSIIRVTDKLYRWGGDEFLILCEGVRTENIELFCTSILSRFSDAIANEENVGKILTISMGVSYFHATDKSFQEVVERADEALYRAKRNGKNRVELSL